jgi:ABC-2 type transport system permease protein
MATQEHVLDGPAPAVKRRSLLRIHLQEARYELIKLLRLPGHIIPTLSFPLIFYIFFGVLFGRGKGGSVNMATYLIASYGAFGVIGASLFGFGVHVATERGQGWLQVKRSTPMPISAYFFAKLAMALLFSATIAISLFILGTTLGGVHLPFAVWPRLFGVLVAGAFPFCALGLAIGYFAGPNSAPPIVNIIYLPMAFLSGLWVPVEMLPRVVQNIAAFLPPYHLAQLALSTFGAGKGSPTVHVIALASYTLLFITLAAIGYDRDEGKTYG